MLWAKQFSFVIQMFMLSTVHIFHMVWAAQPSFRTTFRTAFLPRTTFLPHNLPSVGHEDGRT